MTDSDTVLKQIVAPGEYQVQWALPGSDGVESSTVIGTITLAARAYPSGDIAFDSIPLVWQDGMAAFPQTHQFETLTGKLSTNQDIILLDAAIETWWPGRARVHARGAIVGLLNGSFTGDVVGVRYQTSYLHSLRDIAPIASVHMPLPGHEGPIEWKFTQAESLNDTWSSDSATMTLEYVGSVGAPDGWRMLVRYAARATVDFAEPSTVDAVINDWLVPAQALATLAVGKRADITFAAVGVASEAGNTQWMQLYGGGLTQAPVDASGLRPRDARPALHFGAGSHSMLNMLHTWQSMQNGGEPLFQTYVSVLGVPDDHPRNRMLLLVQAVEGHHGSVHMKQHQQQNAQYKADRKAHLKTLAASEIDPATKKFFKQNVSSRPIRNLNTVLDWAVATLPGNLGDKFAALDIVQTVIDDPDNSAGTWQDAVRTIRNDLAHGNRSYPDRPLRELTNLLDNLVRALVFASVGADAQVLDNLLVADA